MGRGPGRTRTGRGRREVGQRPREDGEGWVCREDSVGWGVPQEDEAGGHGVHWEDDGGAGVPAERTEVGLLGAQRTEGGMKRARGPGGGPRGVTGRGCWVGKRRGRPPPRWRPRGWVGPRRDLESWCPQPAAPVCGRASGAASESSSAAQKAPSLPEPLRGPRAVVSKPGRVAGRGGGTCNHVVGSPGHRPPRCPPDLTSLANRDTCAPPLGNPEGWGGGPEPGKGGKPNLVPLGRRSVAGPAAQGEPWEDDL